MCAGASSFTNKMETRNHADGTSGNVGVSATAANHLLDENAQLKEEVKNLQKQVEHLQGEVENLKKCQMLKDTASAQNRGAKNVRDYESMLSALYGLKFSTKPSSQFELCTYKKRDGTVDSGRDYEYMLCALYALRFSTNAKVIDFKMTSNCKDYGDLDDVALDVITNNSTSQKYLLQLKHSKNKKKLTMNMLTAEKGSSAYGFSINKYFDSFQKLEDRGNVRCILFTNNSAEFFSGSKFSFNSQMVVTKQCTCTEVSEVLLNTNTTSSPCIFQFETEDQAAPEDLKEFLKQFYLFTGQGNVTQIELSVHEILRDLLGCKVDFIHFIQHWWKGNFVLNKHDVITKLTELALTPYIQEISDTKANEKSKPLTDAIMKFEMTIVKIPDEDIARNVWSVSSTEIEMISKASLKYGLTNKGIVDINELSVMEKSKVLWYLNKVPLVIKPDEAEEKRIQGAIKLLEEDGRRKKILLIGNKSRKEFPKWRIFENLGDLLDSVDIAKNFYVSLQERQCIPLEQLIISNFEIARTIGTRELLVMSQRVLAIGNREEELTESYIVRSVSTILLDIKRVLICNNPTNDLIIIFNCDQKFRNTKQLKNIKVKELHDYLKHISEQNSDQELSDLIILSRENSCNVSVLEEICVKTSRRNVYLLKKIDDNCCTLVLGKGDISSLKKHRIEKSTIFDDEIHSYFDNPVNVICAQPGMGKSTLVTYLSNNCPPNCWSVRINLIDHNSFLKGRPSNEEIWSRFVNLKSTDQMTSALVKGKNVHLFLDGLDEIESDSFHFVLDFVEDMILSGIHVWLSSRENLKETITRRLHVFSIDIQELSKEQQRTYIQIRLRGHYDEDKVEDIAKAIFNNADVCNSQQLLGIPLQLYIITENFLNNPDLYGKLNEGIFVLTKMYELFFDGKKKHEYKKLKVDQYEYQLDNDFDHRLEQYELPALHSCLDSATFNRLKVNVTTMKASDVFLAKLETRGDKFGIISFVTSEGRAIFSHQTFAEYFASLWFSKNFTHVRKIKDDFFSVKYENLRLIFDVMMSEKNPLHLAVIYKNPDQITRHVNNFLDEDKAGRNALHLMCAYSTKYEVFNDIFSREWLTSESILENLLKCNPFKRDKLFRWNCFDYSLNCRCLFTIEAILENYGKPQQLKNLNVFFNIISLPLQCSYLGYSNLLAEIIKRNPEVISTVKYDSGKTPLHLALMGSNDSKNQMVYKSKQKHIATIQLLIQNGVDVNLKDEHDHTPLHLASEYGNREAVALLLAEGADVNAVDEDEASALHLASKSGDCSIAKLLLEKGASANIVTKNRETVLHYVLNRMKPNAEAIKLIIDNSNNSIIKAVDKYGRTALDLACECRDCDTVKVLLEKGAEVHFIFHMKMMLKWTSSPNQIDVSVIKLLAKNTDVDVTDEGGYNALHLASEYGDYDTVKVLVDTGVDVKAVTLEKYTMLHCAAKRNSFDENVIKLLLDEGVDVNAEDRNGMSALHYGIIYRRHDFVEILLENGALLGTVPHSSSIDYLDHVVNLGNVKLVQLLLKNITEVENFNIDADSLLYFASRDGRLQADVLLEMTRRIGEFLQLHDFCSRKQILDYVTSSELGLSLENRDLGIISDDGEPSRKRARLSSDSNHHLKGKTGQAFIVSTRNVIN